MGKSKELILPSVVLKYKPGELIVKEGDYGISIYQIIEGKVEIFITSEGGEMSISTLGPGEIIGEMIFLTGHKTRRSASVRTLEKTVLESWHPSRIKEEFDAMPFIVKYITNQTVNLLIRSDRMISDVSKRKDKKTEKAQPKVTPDRAYQNRMLRKETQMDCRYRPIDSSDKVRMWGRAKNISKGGLGLDIRKMNALDYSHAVGDEFIVVAYLPNGKEIEVCVKIANARVLGDKRTLSVGMQFLEIGKNSETNLNFFLLG
jgi:CRP-like cAMP-binding protein